MYLSSVGHDTPSQFTNTLYTPLMLSSTLQYQVGVVKFLCPKSYFILLVNDEDSKIKQGGEIYAPPRNIVNGESIEHIIELYNFPHLRWNKKIGRCELDSEVVFGSRVASVLGFNRLGNKGTAPKHPRTDDGGIDYLLCECDVVSPTPYGNEVVPILDAFILEGGGGRGFSSPVYKFLNTFILSSISIRIVDQNKRDVHFDDAYSSTCLVLHIRPVLYDRTSPGMRRHF